MTARAYTEDQLVEQPAIGLHPEFGWITDTLAALKETLVVYESFEPK